MTLLLEEGLQKIYNEIFPSPEDCQSYNEDADKIRISLMEKMKECDSSFKEVFDGLSLVENYMDLWKTSLPDEFNIYVKLKMSFSIIPIEECSFSNLRPKFIVLNTPGEHRIIHHHRICRQCLQDWIRNLLINIISDGFRLDFDQRTYLYPKNGRGYGIAHTILAKETTPGKREFSFNLVPAFEFRKCEWLLNKVDTSPCFAIPFDVNFDDPDDSLNEFSFMCCAPHREDKIFYGDQNLLKSFRLMKALCTTVKLKCLTSYMLKSVYMKLKRDYGDKPCNKPLEEIFFEALNLLMTYLNDKSSPFFFYKGIHDMDLLPNLNISTLEYILVTFRQLKADKFISYDALARFFKSEIFAQNCCQGCLKY